MTHRRDPILHTHVEDVLPDAHPRAFETILCDGARYGWPCREMLHAFNNECMTTWVETGKGNFCLACFVAIAGNEAEALEEDWGLEIPEGAR